MAKGKWFLAFLAAILVVMLLASAQETNAPQPYQFPQLKFFPAMPMATANPVTKEGAELGRYLFYDPILSKDSTMSCASCHKQAYAFSDSPNTFSTGVDQRPMPRNTMPLFNLAWYESLFWDGRAASIEEQVFHPVRAKNELGLGWEKAVRRIRRSNFYKPLFQAAFGSAEIDSILIAKAIGQFERTLISNNSKYDRVLRGEANFTSDEFAGFELVNNQVKGNCLQCHTTDADALGTTGGFSNNGLEKAASPVDYADKGKGGASGKAEDIGKFKIPSLRNIAVTAPYMHDGRFATLEEVIDFYSNGVNHSLNLDSKMTIQLTGKPRLDPEEKRQIIAFLHTLTDSVFIEDPAFGNPFFKNQK